MKLAALLIVIIAAGGCATDNLSTILSQDRNACASVKGQYLMANVQLQACRANDTGSIISVTPDGAISMEIRESIRAPLVCPACPQTNIREPGLSR